MKTKTDFTYKINTDYILTDIRTAAETGLTLDGAKSSK